MNDYVPVGAFFDILFFENPDQNAYYEPNPTFPTHWIHQGWASSVAGGSQTISLSPEHAKDIQTVYVPCPCKSNKFSPRDRIGGNLFYAGVKPPLMGRTCHMHDPYDRDFRVI